MNHRRVPRYNASVVLYVYLGPEKHLGILTKIALLGLGFNSNAIFDKGMEITVSLQLAYEDKPKVMKSIQIKEKAIVRWKGLNQEKGPHYSYGCEFSEPSPETIVKLEKIIKHIKIDEASPIKVDVHPTDFEG